MALDLNPSFTLFTINFSNRAVDDAPEIKIDVISEGKKSKYFLTNISKKTAYEVNLIFYEDHYHETAIRSASSQIAIFRPGERKEVDVYVEYPFTGCMSHKEYWVEFTNKNGKNYRYVFGFNNSGRITSNLKPIKTRTNTRKQVIPKNKFLLFLSEKYNSLKWKLQRRFSV